LLTPLPGLSGTSSSSAGSPSSACPPELNADPAARERLRREALAAAALDHPFIRKIFEMGEDRDIVFIVVECVVGETLRASLAKGWVPAAC
jgi:serine/threonine protein kinase